MFFMGIDPGKSGAVAVISESGTVMVLRDWPGNEVELAKLFREILFGQEATCIRAAVELVGAMPKQGVTSTFRFGTNFGIWKGMLAAFGIPYQEVRPQAWMKGRITKGDGSNKQAHMAAAARLYPQAGLHGPRGGPKDGRADALLIATWCRENYVQGDNDS